MTSSEPTIFKSLYHLLETRSRTHAEAAAITAPGRDDLNYRALFQQVGTVVRALGTIGVCRNDRVAIVMPNGPEMAVTFLATAATASCCPLNPGYRSFEFEFYLSDLRAKAVIVQAGFDSPVRDVAKAQGITVLEIEPRPDEAAGVFTLLAECASKENKLEFSGEEDVALLLHTSGTTAKPKLVPLTQAGICSAAYNVCMTLQLGSADRCLNIMPLFHIHGLIAALIAPLASGGSVVCTSGLNENRFLAWIREMSGTWYTAVPTMHQLILAEARAAYTHLGLNSLRFIRSSSAPMPPTLIEEIESVFKVPLIEAYGMTEAAHQIASNSPGLEVRKAGSVGPAAGPDVAIMNEAGVLQTEGEVGEIVIRGPNVTRGYEKNPQANETAFTDGWFRTGDLGFLDDENYLFINGRLKEQVNRGGEKISPREVDEALLDHPEIEQAVAFAVPHDTLAEDLAAAVVLSNESSLTEETIREYLFGKLADFKIPSRVVLVSQIPKGPTGKVQRIGLFEKLEGHLKCPYVEPRDAIEIVLAAIWVEVLNTDRVGLSDNFFVLGGDSLSAIQLVSRIAVFFNVTLRLVDVFRRPTVQALGKEIRASMTASDVERIAGLISQIGTTNSPGVSGSEGGVNKDKSRITPLDRNNYRRVK